MPTLNRKAKNWVIYPKFQLVLVALQTGVMIAAFGLISWQIHRSYSHLKTLGVEAGLAPGHPYFKFVDLQSHTTFVNLGVGLAIAALLCTGFTLVLSHRLAGPIVRLRSYFREMGEAESPQVRELKFRKGDFFSDLPDTINRGLKNLDQGKSEKSSDEPKRTAA